MIYCPFGVEQKEQIRQGEAVFRVTSMAVERSANGQKEKPMRTGNFQSRFPFPVLKGKPLKRLMYSG